MAPLKGGSDYIEKSTELPYGKEKKNKLNFDERYQEGKKKKRKT